MLWSLSDPARLADGARAEIEDAQNEVLVSVASAWELAIKAALGRVRFPSDLETAIARQGFQSLGISFAHAALAGRLPPHHGDPFDRMLVAQAQSESLTLVTRDTQLAPYGVAILWA